MVRIWYRTCCVIDVNIVGVFKQLDSTKKYPTSPKVDNHNNNNFAEKIHMATPHFHLKTGDKPIWTWLWFCFLGLSSTASAWLQIWLALPFKVVYYYIFFLIKPLFRELSLLSVVLEFVDIWPGILAQDSYPWTLPQKYSR